MKTQYFGSNANNPTGSSYFGLFGTFCPYLNLYPTPVTLFCAPPGSCSPSPPSLLEEPSDTVVARGEPVTLNCKVGANQPLISAVRGEPVALNSKF